jgi:tRNA A37 methylthiotransferase MiaB
MGRTRTNKIVVLPRELPEAGEADNELIGQLVDVRIERANGFSLYGMPILTTSRGSHGDRS